MVWQSLDVFLTRVRPHRQGLSLLIDVVVVAFAWQVTYLFRLGFERWASGRPGYDHWVLLGVVTVYLAVFRLLAVPKGMWRFAGFGEITRLMAACAIAGSVCAIVVLMAQLREVPRAVLALHPVLAWFALCGARVGYRTLYEHMRMKISGRSGESRRALVLGAGDAARRLLAGIQHEGWTVVGLLDDDRAKHDGRVAGVPVLGPIADAPRLAATQGISHLIIAMPSARGAVKRRIIEEVAQIGLPVLTVPGADELREGSSTRVRDIRPEDLLGREPVNLDEKGIAEGLNDKTVLVTGAGGSIGAELCRQIARYGPRRLVLLELSEFALYSVEQELSEHHPYLPIVPLLGDVKEAGWLRAAFLRCRPEVVFHAAAYKHVPLLEQDNAWAALRNNALGTYVTARIAGESGVERFVLISSDKAVNPTNVMGATKRVAEMAISGLVPGFPHTKFMAVRFGNVLGSSGSVIPKFKEQIARGGPVTVTHPDVVRYFMTIPEAVRLVLQAGALGATGEVYVLDMGQPIRIQDLARDMILMSGHSLEDIPIVYSGLRPGEKLFEELLADDDTTQPTTHPRLRIAVLNNEIEADMMCDLERGLPTCASGSAEEAVKHWLRRYVREYRPT